jgi:hypothetical protein
MSTIVARFRKDADAQLDYVMDWSDWFADFPDDTIADSVWAIETVEAPAEAEVPEIINDATGTKATAVWLRGGTNGSGGVYDAVNTITSSSNPSRIDERRFRIVIP